MSITSFSFRNYRFVLVATIAALALGTIGFLRMPRQEDPTLSAFSGIITVVFPGASVDEIEEEIIEPLEKAVHGLEDVDVVESTARPGFATITAEFREESDKERAYDRLLQEISAVEAELPKGVVDVRTIAAKPSNVAVMQIVVHSRSVDRAALLGPAEEIERRVRSLPDVKEALLRGELEREVHVVVNPTRLAEAGLSLGQVEDALGAGDARIPGGAVSAGSRRLSVRPVSRYDSIDAIGRTVLRTVEGRPIRVADVARIEEATADPIYLVRHNGEPGISVVLTMKEGRNVFDLARDVHEILDDFREDLPPGVAATVVADQSRDVANRLRTFGGSLLQGGLVIALFVALLAGWRPALAVVTAVLLSVGISFWALSSLGIALHQMSIAGLVVVLGLLVDNAIVVVESILERRRKGADARQSAIEGTDEVASAVASSTATTVAAFVPMLLMAGSVGEFTRDIPIVVCVVLIVSLLVALCLTPLLTTLWIGDGTEGRSLRPWFRRVVADGLYRQTLLRALAAPRRAIALAFAIGAVPFVLIPLLGTNFFPRAEKDLFLVRVNAPEGTTIEGTSARVEEVEEWLLARPEVSTVTTNLGEGNPTVYYNQFRAPAATHFAELLVVVESKTRDALPLLAREARLAFANSPDFVLETKTFIQGPPVGLPVSIRLYGADLDRLSHNADLLASRLRQIPGAINVSNGLSPGAPRLDLEVDRVKLNQLGLNGAAVAREVRLSLAGSTAAQLRRDDEGIDVIVRVAEEGNERIDDLERIRFPLPGGGSLPLAQLTRPVLAPTFAQINHTNLERSVIVGADVDGRLATAVMADLLPFAQSLDLRGDESFEVIGEDEERDRAFLSMLANVVVAVGLIYGILVLQFRSFLHPVLIFSSIPIAFGGSVAALFLSGWSFGFTAFIGVLALTGIVVNNAIVLVDRINQLRRDGRSPADAVLEGTTSRFQPILLTTTTTIAGLLPLTLTGSSMWAPLGWVVIGGLLSSTLVTLLLVPTSYYLIARREGAPAPERDDDRPPARRLWIRRAVLPLLALCIASAQQSRAEGSAIGDAGAFEEPSTSAFGDTGAFEEPSDSAFGDTGASEEPSGSAPVPVNFSQVLELLDERSPDLAIAQADADAASSRAALAASTRWPVVAVSGGWEVTDDPARTFGLALSRGLNPLLAPLPTPVDALAAEVRAHWVLWDASRGPGVNAAERGVDAAESSKAWVRASLQLQAAEAWFGLVALMGEVQVLETAVAQVRRERADAEQRALVGRAVHADVLGLTARARALEAALGRARGDVQTKQARIARLLLLPPTIEVLPDEEETIPTVPFPALEAALRAASSREDIEARKQALAAAHLEVRSREGERWPRLVGSARYTGTAPERDFGDESRAYAAAVGFEWTAFRGGGFSADIEVSRAALSRIRAEHDRLSAEVAEDVVAAWAGRETARGEERAASAGLEAAEEAFRIVGLRFREGRDTLSRYLEAERARTEAASLATRARSGVSIAEARLRWATGSR